MKLKASIRMWDLLDVAFRVVFFAYFLAVALIGGRYLVAAVDEFLYKPEAKKPPVGDFDFDRGSPTPQYNSFDRGK
jgi:hypothetical protein